MRRFVALLLLLFCGIDLGFADNCAEDPGPFESQTVLMHLAESAGPAEIDHECFCCCRHIVHEPFFQVEAVASPPAAAVSLEARPGESSWRTIFRPPRV